MSRAIDAAPPSNASVVPVGHRPARQLKPILIDARDRQNQRPLLRDSYAATIMGSPRHWPSHPDCRCLLTQIAALHPGEAQPLIEAGDIFLVARQAVERLRDDNIKIPMPRIFEELLETRPQSRCDGERS